MLYCQNCGCELNGGAKFCTSCGTPVPNAQNAQNNTDQNGQNQQNGYDPNNPYNGYNPYDPYNAYYPPMPKKLDIGMLAFTIINFFICGILAIWPLVHLIGAYNAETLAEQADSLKKCKNANIICLVIVLAIIPISIIMLAILGAIFLT